MKQLTGSGLGPIQERSRRLLRALNASDAGAGTYLEAFARGAERQLGNHVAVEVGVGVFLDDFRKSAYTHGRGIHLETHSVQQQQR